MACCGEKAEEALPHLKIKARVVYGKFCIMNRFLLNSSASGILADWVVGFLNSHACYASIVFGVFSIANLSSYGPRLHRRLRHRLPLYLSCTLLGSYPITSRDWHEWRFTNHGCSGLGQDILRAPSSTINPINRSVPITRGNQPARYQGF